MFNRICCVGAGLDQPPGPHLASGPHVGHHCFRPWTAPLGSSFFLRAVQKLSPTFMPVTTGRSSSTHGLLSLPTRQKAKNWVSWNESERAMLPWPPVVHIASSSVAANCIWVLIGSSHCWNWNDQFSSDVTAAPTVFSKPHGLAGLAVLTTFNSLSSLWPVERRCHRKFTFLIADESGHFVGKNCWRHFMWV